MRNKHVTCVDVFAGAGGFSLAARNLGIDVRLAIEFDNHAATTYRQNLCVEGTLTRVLNEDIRAVDLETETKEMFPEKGACDLLLGGPPCQGYSTHRIKDSGVNDERNSLIRSYFDCVDVLKPRAFIMENVPGMLWSRHKEYVDEFYSRAELSGYWVSTPVVLDARDYGVPQRRKRVFILGLREKRMADLIEWPPRPTHVAMSQSEIDRQLLPWSSCGHVFQNLPTNDPNNVHMNHGAELVQAFKNTPANGGSRRDSGRILDCHRNHNGHKDVYGRIDPNQPAPTMTTACINPSKGRFVHPTKHHGITVRQAARIQTFPDEFIFHGGLTAAGKQIGNAVPIALGEAVIRAVLPAIHARAPVALNRLRAAETV